MQLFRNLYLTNRFFILLTGVVVLFLFSYALPALLPAAKLFLFLLGIFTLINIMGLFRLRKALFARRLLPERMANGSENPVTVYLENRYPFEVEAQVVDELPFQFQKRDTVFRAHLKSSETKAITYQLRPVKRGEYHFGKLNVYLATMPRLVQRRYRFDEEEMIPVYPSFLEMRKYELLAISNRLMETGIKQIRRLGHSMEFEHIRNYVIGDDPRSINWKATARQGNLMVNAYQEDRSQQVFCLIDKGRVMKMPFEGLSLLDYAINASLVMSNTALQKGDKAGLVTFSDTIGGLVPAGKQRSHLNTIMQVLYNQRTKYLETDYERLCSLVQRKITQRSLLILFTNFETLSGMRRQLVFLRRLAKRHLLLVVFFENTELSESLQAAPRTTGEIYLKITTEKFLYEKRLIVKELNSYGIQTILTPPEDLTVNTINKYLELKARRMI